MHENNFINELKNKLEIIQKEIAELQTDVRDKLRVIEEKQKSAEYIIKLLAIEGANLQDNNFADIISKSIADIAYEELIEDTNKNPIHYRDLYNRIISKGIPISGKDPEANLLTHISRDTRFVRVSSGTYGLSEWGLIPMSKRNRRKKKR